MSWKERLFHAYFRVATKVSTYQEYRLTRPFLQGKVLDIGCGPGGVADFVLPENYTGIDVVAEQLARAKIAHPSHNFYLADCTDNKGLSRVILDKKFDTVLLLTLLEFIPDPKGLVTNCRELLKDNGRLIITTPASFIGKMHGHIYQEINNPVTAASYFNKKSITGLLEDAFIIERFKTYNLGMSYFVMARANGKKIKIGNSDGK